MSIEPRPISDILAELLPKYLSNAQETSQPGFDGTVERFRDLNIGPTSLTMQSRVG